MDRLNFERMFSVILFFLSVIRLIVLYDVCKKNVGVFHTTQFQLKFVQFH